MVPLTASPARPRDAEAGLLLDFERRAEWLRLRVGLASRSKTLSARPEDGGDIPEDGGEPRGVAPRGRRPVVTLRLRAAPRELGRCGLAASRSTHRGAAAVVSNSLALLNLVGERLRPAEPRLLARTRGLDGVAVETELGDV